MATPWDGRVKLMISRIFFRVPIGAKWFSTFNPHSTDSRSFQRSSNIPSTKIWRWSMQTSHHRKRNAKASLISYLLLDADHRAEASLPQQEIIMTTFHHSTTLSIPQPKSPTISFPCPESKQGHCSIG